MKPQYESIYTITKRKLTANNKGKRDTSVRSRLKTSIAKIIAAIGALKIEDIAPAAAHPIKRFRVAWFKCNNLDKLDAILAPPETVGPSNPAEPPNPMVMGAVKTEANI